MYEHIGKILQLHEQVQVIYVVDGYRAQLSFQDGDVLFMEAFGDTIEKALQNLDRHCDLYVICVHVPTKQWFSLNRSYGLNGPPEQAPNKIPYRRLHQAVEVTENHRYVQGPNWADDLNPSDFTCYWMY